MRLTICFIVMLALIGLNGCAKKDAATVEEPETTTDSQPISDEDFESGEVESVVGDAEGVETEVVEEEGDEPENTP